MSALEIIKYANLDDMFEPRKHVLAVGRPQSGKTTFLLYCARKYREQDETIIVRDIDEFFEFLTLADKEKIIGFFPEGCKINFEHPNFSQKQFDIMRLETLFEQFEEESINLLFLENFFEKPINRVRIWRRFFEEVLKWKRKGRGQEPWCLIIDEFGDTAPGRGRNWHPEQLQTAQLIATNQRKFLRHNIRFVAAVHSFRDITVPVRKRFDCYFILKNDASADDVPDALINYIQLFPKLALGKAIFLDSNHNFNEVTMPQYVRVKKFYDLDLEGAIDEMFEEKTDKRTKLWKDRAMLNLEIMSRHGINLEEVAKDWNMTPQSLYELRHDWHHNHFGR